MAIPLPRTDHQVLSDLRATLEGRITLLDTQKLLLQRLLTLETEKSRATLPAASFLCTMTVQRSENLIALFQKLLDLYTAVHTFIPTLTPNFPPHVLQVQEATPLFKGLDNAIRTLRKQILDIEVFQTSELPQSSMADPFKRQTHGRMMCDKINLTLYLDEALLVRKMLHRYMGVL